MNAEEWCRDLVGKNEENVGLAAIRQRGWRGSGRGCRSWRAVEIGHLALRNLKGQEMLKFTRHERQEGYQSEHGRLFSKYSSCHCVRKTGSIQWRDPAYQTA